MPQDPADLLLAYLDALPHPPYPVQEQAIEAWFSGQETGAKGGILLSAPTGTGKTLVAEAACFEALHTGRRCYYTTPLIALTEQKFAELQDKAEKWGFPREFVGLVTGNRSVNPHARVLVVVAEILLNRLLHQGQEDDFNTTESVVMDEFHWFSEPDRGMVWELSLTLLPPHVRVMLLSATVGNAYPFCSWLRTAHDRDIALVQTGERRVPLTFQWVNDLYLSELLTDMAKGTLEGNDATARTPALVFCFDREACWDTAEELRGKDLLKDGQFEELAKRLEEVDFSKGIGPKMKRLLQRGVGVHHAGLLPHWKKLVEDLFQDKLLSVCVCTETLAAGMNLPARSVVLASLVKGPPTKRKLIDPSSAHQMFGRAGRPQFDTQGFVYAVAHQDDVEIARHLEKVAQIPESNKDPVMMKKRKALIKKAPKRREGFVYWNEAQFKKLQEAEPAKLESKGRLPWRLLAYLLDAYSDVSLLKTTVKKRLMPEHLLRAAQEDLVKMLTTLHEGNYVVLEPAPPGAPTSLSAGSAGVPAGSADEPAPLPAFTFGTGIAVAPKKLAPTTKPAVGRMPTAPAGKDAGAPGTLGALPAPLYEPLSATPTPKLKTLLTFRATHPLYGAWLLDYLGQADERERLQILESLLEFPKGLLRHCRVPQPEWLPPGPLAKEIVDPAILTRGILSHEALYPPPPKDGDPWVPPELRRYAPPLAEKMALLFHASVPHAQDLITVPVWCAGPLLYDFGGDFHKYISAKELSRQEGNIFRHCMRLILLCEEFQQVTPHGVLKLEWQAQLKGWAEKLTETCRAVDPQCTDELLATAHAIAAQ